METTYRKYQNFFGEVDEEKERDTIQSLMRPEDYKILELYPDMSLGLLIDAEHVLAYRRLLEDSEEVTPETFSASLDAIYTYSVFNYYTDDLNELKRYPIGYLSINFEDLYDDDGNGIDDGKPLEVDLNFCYIINGWTYEILS